MSRESVRFSSAKRILVRDWWILVLCGLVGALVGLTIYFFEDPVYAGSSTLYVTPGYGGGSASANVYQDELAAQQRAVSYSKLVVSDVIGRRAVEGAGAPMSLESYRGSVSASVTPDTTLLTITARTEDPRLSAALSNSAARAVADYVGELEKSDNNAGVTRLSVVTPAVESSVPVSPVLRRSLLFGFVSGLLAGIIVVVLRARYDDRIRVPGDVGHVADVPVLASIPKEDEGKLLGNETVFQRGSIAVESYRRLFVNLRFFMQGRSSLTILVTSPRPSDGKSTVSLNLAAAIRDAGHSVIVVDADLRRPVLAARSGVSADVGLGNVFRGDGSLAEFVQFGLDGEVAVLAAGALPPSPAQVLDSSRLREAIEELKREFDFVIVDTPPLLVVADASLVSPIVDVCVVVAVEGVTRRWELRSALSSIEGSDSGANNVGVVLNRCDRSPASYSDYGSYRSEELADDSQ